MNVLVACEYSGTVRDAFYKRGHHAVSCDILPSDTPGPHIQGDVIQLLRSGRHQWDLIIAHPPCTYLCNSGVLRLYKEGKKENGMDTNRWVKMYEAVDFFDFFVRLYGAKVCVENPIMHGYAKKIIARPYAQIIQPWQFGHPESKATCLWLQGLPKLEPTNILNKPARGYWDNQTPSGENKLGPSKNRGLIRAKTYQGIADAMAEQWG